jgi:hypothetical protein
MKSDRIDRIVLLSAAAILFWQLFVPPVVGLANNGDFHKVIGGFSLAAPIEDEYKFAPTVYTFDPSHYFVTVFYSTEGLLVAAASGLNTLASKTGTFDLRWIGLVHGALYLAALRLALPLLRNLGDRVRIFCAALLLFVFGDALYISALNSFYMDTCALVFFLLTIVSACRVLAWRRRVDTLCFLLFALCFICSKVQHAPLGLLIALTIVVQPSVFLPGLSASWRAIAIGALAAAVIFMLSTPPREYRATPLFSQIFYGILPRSHDPARDIRALGLDDSYKRYIGMHAYSEGTPLPDPGFDQAFLKQVSTWRLVWLYARSPALTYSLLRDGLSDAGRERARMGNFDRAAGLPPSAESRSFALWSGVKAAAFEGRGGWYLAYTLALAAAFNAALLAKRTQLARGIPLAGFTLTLMMLAGLLIGILGDPVDSVRHAFLFLAMNDAVLVAFVILAGAPWRPGRSVTTPRSPETADSRPPANAPPSTG